MKQLIGTLLLLAILCAIRGATSPHQQAHSLDATLSHGVHLSYLLFLPASYAAKPDTDWPLILYLHGGSLRGGNVEQLRTLGLPHKLESEPDFRFVVVSPQCPAGEIWTDTEAIDALLVDVVLPDHMIQQGIDGFCVCPDFTCRTLRRNNDEWKIWFTFQLMGQTERA